MLIYLFIYLNYEPHFLLGHVTHQEWGVQVETESVCTVDMGAVKLMTSRE